MWPAKLHFYLLGALVVVVARSRTLSAAGFSFDGVRAPTRTFATTTVHRSKRARYHNVDEMLDSLGKEGAVGVVVFTAIHCGPCKLQKQELQRLLRKADVLSVKVLTIETEKWPAVCQRFEVHKLPCLLITRGNRVVQRCDGLVSAEELLEMLQTTSATAAD